ncbi:exported hypothetical protein [Burkholderiales bacterium]|nr:exported hypothetical protein [Burkholderiales bacterium]
MNTHRRIKALLGIMCALVACGARAAPDLPTQEQSERCNKLVDKQFQVRRAVAGTDEANMRSRFESHYNVKRSKCFFLEVVTGAIVDKASDKASTIEIQALWDADENLQYGWFKEYGSLGVNQSECFVQKTVCRGREEWKRLIQPFLQE